MSTESGITIPADEIEAPTFGELIAEIVETQRKTNAELVEINKRLARIADLANRAGGSK